jgi:putative sigma-54 modulation protein
MRLQVKGRNVEVSESIRSYAEEKLSRLERQLADPTRVEVELAVERNPSIADSHVAEATVFTKGPVLHAREASADMKASIDQLADKLERQVTRYRSKRRRGRRRSNGPDLQAVPEGEPQIVKTKQFALTAVSPEDAVLQLELVGHDFYVFRNGATAEINVVYRRRGGGYGLIEPQ